jgi:hypothetical protein
MEKIYSARKGKFMDIKRNFCIYRLNKKLEQSMQEQRSKVKDNYLSDTALALMTTYYTPIHMHTQIQPHANIHITSI